MMSADIFFAIVFLTVAVTRLFLYVRPPAPGPRIYGFRIHHYVYGLFGIAVGIIGGMPIVYAVGVGLFVDELALILMRGDTHEENYSTPALVGTALFVCLVFLLRDYLILPFQ